MATTGSYSWGGYDNIIRSVELTNFTATYDDATYLFLYIVIGKQQWRMLKIQATEQKVAFPIAFTEWCVAYGSRATGTGGNPTTLGANAAFSDPVTLTYATVFSIEVQEYYLLAVGKQQWGEYVDGYNTFPTEFTAFCVIAAGGEYMYSDLGSTILEIELHRFRALANLSGTKKTYIAAGKQQWGSNDGAQNNFPIPFSNCLNLQQWQWDTSAMNNSGIVNNIQYDDTGYTCNGNYKLRFLAVGIAQQWGLQRMTTSYTTYQLPISYSEIHIAIIGQENERNKGLGLRPDGLNSFNAAISVSGDTQNMRYLSIGKQQWGYGFAGTITYPVQFTEVAYTAFASDIAESNATISEVAINPPELNQIIVRPSSAKTITWLVIGKQQWGLTGNDPGNGGASAQLSIPITILIFGQARTTSSETISSVFSIDVADDRILYIDSSNIQYQGGYAYLIGSR